MLITPGPAFVLIPLGLALLSLEFAWAEALLDRALGTSEQAKPRPRESTRTERVLIGDRRAARVRRDRRVGRCGATSRSCRSDARAPAAHGRDSRADARGHARFPRPAPRGVRSPA